MPLLDLFWAMLWFFLWIAWISLVISVVMDIFRSDDLNGLGKALWSLFVIALPFLGVFVYLIARGDSMAQRNMDNMSRQQQASQDYIRSVAGSGGSVADELTKLGALRDQGAITDAEFQAQKSKLLA